MTLRHVVAWKLATTDDAERKAQAQRIADDLLALQPVIPEILTITVGADVLRGGNWDVAIVADFADLAGLEAYAKHPAHQEAGAYIRSVVANRVAVDFEI